MHWEEKITGNLPTNAARVTYPSAMTTPPRHGARSRHLRPPAAWKRATHHSLAPLLCLAVACGGSPKGARGGGDYDPDVARYRLPLRHNPVDPGEAFRCYGNCQNQSTPDGYLGCLAQCPAFEVTQGVACGVDDVPPLAACITARRLPDREELNRGYRVVATVAGVALVVALGVACASTQSCGAYYYAAPPGQPPLPLSPY